MDELICGEVDDLRERYCAFLVAGTLVSDISRSALMRDEGVSRREAGVGHGTKGGKEGGGRQKNGFTSEQ
jgi:hypothetical protein